MDRWTLLTYGLIGAVGALVFLRLVSNEVALRLRALDLRVSREKQRREEEKKKAQEQVDEDVVVQATPVPEQGTEAA